MVDLPPNSILNFDSGISRVVWDTPTTIDALPDRRQLPPSELAVTLQLDRLLQADNVETALGQSLRPQVGSPDILRPERFDDAMRSIGGRLERAFAAMGDQDKQALAGLAAVLKEHDDLTASLHFYRDMLIAG